MTTAVEFKNVDIIFGNNTRDALAMARAVASTFGHPRSRCRYPWVVIFVSST